MLYVLYSINCFKIQCRVTKASEMIPASECSISIHT